MFTSETSRLSRIASAIGLAAVIAISVLANLRDGGRAPPGAGSRVTTASASPAVTRLPEVVVVASRLDPEGPRFAH